jgi:hypothetical protein
MLLIPSANVVDSASSQLVMVQDSEGGVWEMNLDARDAFRVVEGLKLLCTDAPMDTPEIWACEKAALVLLQFVVFELNPHHAWVFERMVT